MLTKDKTNGLQSSSVSSIAMKKRILVLFRATGTVGCKTEMFPETDELSKIISDTETMFFIRRLVDRVLRLWTEMAHGGRFPASTKSSRQSWVKTGRIVS